MHLSELGGSDTLLCPRGLPLRGGLIKFCYPSPVDAESRDQKVDVFSLNKIRRDDDLVRECFTARHGSIETIDRSAREEERTKRSAQLLSIYRLYQVGRNQTPVELRRELQRTEVETLINCLRRLTLMSPRSVADMTGEAVALASSDWDLLAHVMDPLQLRYLLSNYDQSTADFIGQDSVNTLLDACRSSDRKAVRAWFGTIYNRFNRVPNDITQFLRSLLLHLWREGKADLGALAYETAVLDTRLFFDLGWEMTRTFCAQLRRITGPRADSLDVFLSVEDIDSAMRVAESLNQEDLVVHFSQLADRYSTQRHNETRNGILAAVSGPPIPHPRAETVPTQNQPLSKAEEEWLKFLRPSKA